MVDEDAPLWQRFVDSDGGNNLATFTHTMGAAFFVLGVGMLLVWAWLVRRDPSREPWRNSLVAAQWFTLAGIGLNGAGGLMRLVQSDHPKLTEFGSNPWVQYIFIKHVFLIAGFALALFLIVRFVPRPLRVLWWPPWWKRRAEPVEPPRGRGPTYALSIAAFVMLSALLAGVLGAYASTVGPGTELPPQQGAYQVFETPRSPRSENLTFAGNAQVASPVTAFQNNHPFELPAGLVRIRAVLTWTNPGSELALGILNGDGREVGNASAVSPTRMEAQVDGGFTAGNWTAAVSSTRALNENYVLTVRLEIARDPLTRLEGFAVVEPGTFAEINLLMEEGATMHFEWGTDPAYELDFDVHYHQGDETFSEHVARDEEMGGDYTAPVTSIHSPIWVNDGEAVAMVTFIVSGPFRIHSVVGL